MTILDPLIGLFVCLAVAGAQGITQAQTNAENALPKADFMPLDFHEFYRRRLSRSFGEAKTRLFLLSLLFAGPLE